MVRIVCLLMGYVFGLFQTAYIYGKLHGIDIREHGSGNSGSTNMLRTLGKKAGAITFLGDCLKCVLAVVLTRVLFGKSHGEMITLLCFYSATGVILGHNFPFYLGFRGGKGMAATAGLIMSIDPIMSVLGWATFLIVFFTTHYVSLGSLIVYIGIEIELIVLGQMGHFGMSQAHLNELYILGFLLMLLAFWQHRENIKRLLNGTEHKTYLSNKE